MSTDKVTFLLNWKATAYHLPIFMAQANGYFKDEGVKVAILEPNDPSDVTELIGAGNANLGVKALIHTIAGKSRGFPIKSLGTLMDEPFTGVLYLKQNGLTEDFQTLKGKRIGYVGEFGKIQIDEITAAYGWGPEDYTPVRCGMAIAENLISGNIDAGVGLENIQQVELEQWLISQGRPITDVGMHRIDKLANPALGCCCFCSILLIGNENWIDAHPKETAAVMKAIKRGTDFMLANPVAAWKRYVEFKPVMNTRINALQYDRSFNYMSRDLANVSRDWNKVTGYAKRLGIVPNDFKQNYTNEFLVWPLEKEAEDGEIKQQEITAIQKEISQTGGLLFKANEIAATA